MVEQKILHRVIRRVAGWAVVSFFTRVHLIGEENVPKDGPMIVVATHHNMMLDPAVLSSAFPHRRILNYWTKATLFANPIMKWVLLSSGNIPVDRKSKDNQVLFRGTFQALSQGQAMAIFPEGTSYTEPRIMQVKDGASWSALEYMKWAKANPDKAAAKGVVVVPVGIVYTNKSKYRSEVIMEFGEPIPMTEFEAEFLSSEDGASRAAVKKLTQQIESGLIRATINAPDWDTLYAARMARDLLWEKDKSIKLDDFVAISQTLVDLFSTTDATPNFFHVRRRLLEYYSLLQSTRLTNSVLSALPLPRTLDPNHPAPLPSRLLTLSILTRDSLACLIRLPFFFFPLMVHLPAYVMSRLGARLVEDEEETQAQNKIVFALLLLLMIYPAAFSFLWALFWYTPGGALIAAATVWLFAYYHVKIINDNYEHAKRLMATWRVLVGVWAPKKWDMSLAALKQYTTPLTPPESPWVTRVKNGQAKASTSTLESTPTPTPALAPSDRDAKGRRRHPPSRRLVRHVLRARAEAARALASFFAQLEKSDAARVRASAHLARLYDGTIDVAVVAHGPTSEGVAARREVTGWRSAREVVAFLRQRGAKIASLEHEIEGDWAALSSDGEGDSSDTVPDKDEDIIWVPPSQK